MKRDVKWGREEGAQTKALEVARNLLDDAAIAAKTGLSTAQIKQLRLAGTR